MADALAWFFGVSGVIWVVCGTLAYGYNTACFTKQWPETTHENRLSCLMASLGPIGLWVAVEDGGAKYGLLFRRRRWIRQYKSVRALEK